MSLYLPEDDARLTMTPTTLYCWQIPPTAASTTLASSASSGCSTALRTCTGVRLTIAATTSSIQLAAMRRVFRCSTHPIPGTALVFTKQKSSNARETCIGVPVIGDVSIPCTPDVGPCPGIPARRKSYHLLVADLSPIRVIFQLIRKSCASIVLSIPISRIQETVKSLSIVILELLCSFVPVTCTGIPRKFLAALIELTVKCFNNLKSNISQTIAFTI